MADFHDSTIGTVLLDPPMDMPYKEILEIVRMVTEITEVEGGYSMSATCGGTMMFFHMSEEESDELLSRLRERFGDNARDLFSYAYDDEFSEDDEDDGFGYGER